MTNTIVELLLSDIENDFFEFLNDSEKFFKKFLSNPQRFGQVSNKDIEEALKLVNVWSRSLPPRTSGELVYTMAFLPIGPKETHITLLGPVLFSDQDGVQEYIQLVKRFLSTIPPVEISLAETEDIVSASGVQSIHKVFRSDSLLRIHNYLIALAERCDGKLVEEHFSGDNYLPHITCVNNCQQDPDTRVFIRSAEIVLHPGGKLNIENSKTLAIVNLLGEDSTPQTH